MIRNKNKKIYTNINIDINTILCILPSQREYHYLKNVLKLQKGEIFTVFNQYNHKYLTKILHITNQHIQCIVLKKINNIIREKQININLAICIIKPNKMKKLIFWTSIIGINKIIPIISSRSQPQQCWNFNKMYQAMIDGINISNRSTMPQISKIITLQHFSQQNQNIIFLNEKENDNHINDIKNIQNCTILVGPEGGFSQNEISFLINHNSTYSVSLGKINMTSEIAAISSISYINILND